MYSKTMKACDFFIKRETGDQRQAYSTDPNGKVNVPRLLGKEDAFWEIQIPKESLVKAVIVLTDWSYNYGARDAGVRVEWLYDLLEQGFELYAWTGKLVEIHSDYDLQKALKNIQPVHPAQVEQICSQKDIAKDRLKIIDYFERRRIEAILGESGVIDATFNFCDIDEGFSPEVQEKILHSLSSYLFFEVEVNVAFIKDFDLLLKCAALPQSLGLICKTYSLTAENSENFIQLCNHVPINELYFYSIPNPVVFDEVIYPVLNNLKGMSIGRGWGVVRFMGYNDAVQLSSIGLEETSFQKCKLHALQALTLQSSALRSFHEIASNAPNIETLFLADIKSYGESAENKIQLLKLKKVFLENVCLDKLIATFDMPLQLEELTLDEIYLDETSTRELEGLTRLKKLSLKNTVMPAEYFINVIKNNIYLEEIQLEHVKFCGHGKLVELTELIEKSSPFMLSLRSIRIQQSKFSDINALASTLLAQIHSIEEIHLGPKKFYNSDNKIFYQKNHKIFLNGASISPSLLSLLLNHSTDVNSITIDCELITADLITEALLAHKDKLTRIKKLDLSDALLAEECIALYPGLKRIVFDNISLKHGTLKMTGDVDFKPLLSLVQHNKSELTGLILKDHQGVFNEELILQYQNDFSFKSLSIENDNISSHVVCKLISSSPRLESILLHNNCQNQVIEPVICANSLEKLILKKQSIATIGNILKQRPSLKHLELDIAEENDALFKLIEQYIATSPQLNHLILTGKLSTNRSQKILDYLINTHREMDTLILAEHFIFKKNQQLTARIPTPEAYLLDLLRASPKLEMLHINQPVPIRKMFADRLWHDLRQMSVTSCLDTQVGFKSLANAFDWLLSRCPHLEKNDLTINFYTQDSFFIINQMKASWDRSLRLQTTEGLSNSQIVCYNKRLQCTQFAIQGIDGLLLESLGNDCNFDLKDSASLLANLDVICKRRCFYDLRLNSPWLKISQYKLEWDGDKLSDEQILKVLETGKKLGVNTVTIHHKLSLAVIRALHAQTIRNINLVHVTHQDELIHQLIKEDITVTGRNSSQQVLYKIKYIWGKLNCTGVRFPPALLFCMIKENSALRISSLILEDFSFAVPPILYGETDYSPVWLVLKNANVRIDFIEHYLAHKRHMWNHVTVSNCSGIRHEQLNILAGKFPNSILEYLEEKKTAYSPSRQFLPSDNSFQQEFTNHATVDVDTGEQKADTDFSKGSSSFFRAKKFSQLYPNYLRLRVQHEGANDIKTLNNILYTQDIINLYEKHYAEHPDYYLDELTLSLQQDTWYVLRSITPEDKLCAFNASEVLELGYSKQKNLFYIRGTKSCQLSITYMLHAVLDIRYSNEPMDEKYRVYFPCIQSIDFETNTLGELFHEQFLSLQKMSREFREELLIAFCRFDVGELSNSSVSGKKLLNLLIRERKGVCRHNVYAFTELKAFFNQNLPVKLRINARASGSEIHDFIEVERNNKWQMICLGGAAMPKAINAEEEQAKPQYMMKPIIRKKPPVVVENSPAQQIESQSSAPQEPDLPNEETYPAKEEPSLLAPQQDDPEWIDAQATGVEQVPEMYQDFRYVLSLNPFMSLKPRKTIPAVDFSGLATQLMVLTKDLNSGEKNLLLNFDSPTQIELFYAAMASVLRANQQHFLLIHQPDHFNPVEFIVAPETGEYSRQHTALMKSVQLAKPGDFLIVNVSDYNEKTVALLNALAERKNRVLANQAVPEAVTILAVKLNKTALGQDVYSRFLNQEYFVPTLTEQDLFASFCKPLPTQVPDEDVIVVDFYDGVSWKSQLIGSLELEEQHVRYQSGALINMIAAGKSCIRFYNPPMEREDFRVFLLSLLNTRVFDANGRSYCLPEDFSFESASKTHDLACSSYPYRLEKHCTQKEGSYVLNATSYHHFFNNFQCEDGHFTQKDGWFSQHAHQELRIWVTGCLHEALWARFLDAANERQVSLIIAFESRLLMPQGMRKRDFLEEQVIVEQDTLKNHLIVSNDAYFAEIQCRIQDERPSVVFEVNENTHFSNLFESMQLRKEAADLAVDWHSCPVREHLLRGQRVILKGRINQELADKLHGLFSSDACVFVNGKKERYNGQLILILDENKYFNSASLIHHKYQRDDFYQYLSSLYPETRLDMWKLLLEAFLQKALSAGISLDFNYLTIKSMLDFHQKYPEANPFLAFILLHPQHRVLKNIALSVYPEQSHPVTSVDDFDVLRKQSVSQLLDYCASGFLVGPSGVGKTTFMKTAFAGVDVLFGLSQLETWAKDGGIFYLDEINLYPQGTLDFFAGLFNSTPGLLLNNQFYPIQLGTENGSGCKKHQILFGGNYSDFTNRQSHAFLQQVPAVEFAAFPDWYLKERVLKKALQIACSFEDDVLNGIMSVQLKVYHHVNAHNPRAEWTVRNLENMALRFVLFREERPDESPEMQAWLSAYDELNNHNEARWITEFQAWIATQYALQETIASLNARMNHKNGSFKVTECRQNVFRLMQDQVKMQKLKNKYVALRDFGAVGGCLMEGESGIGKSRYAIELAESLGYRNGDMLATGSEAAADCYYFISPNLDASAHATASDALEQRLITLFHAGALVIIDELNSFELEKMLALEKVLNALMSGVDLSMQKAKNAGFFVFASQNPVHYIGRKKLAVPLENRMFKLELLDYSQKSLTQIAQQTGLHPLFAKASAAFFHQSTLKRGQNASLETPNFRSYLDKIASIQQNNPLSRWIFLEKVYAYLDKNDRQALYCTSLFCLSAFAFLHQSALADNPVAEKKDEVIQVENIELAWDQPAQNSISGDDFEEASEDEFENEFEPLLPGIPYMADEESTEQNSCCSGIGMQILGGFIAALGVTAVAVAFVVLEASTLGLAGVILALIGGASILVGTGLFVKGVVDSCSIVEEPDPHVMAPSI